MTKPEKIRIWVERNFPANQHERAFQDLLDTATGNKTGNEFERSAIARIFPDSVFAQKK